MRMLFSYKETKDAQYFVAERTLWVCPVWRHLGLRAAPPGSRAAESPRTGDNETRGEADRQRRGRRTDPADQARRRQCRCCNDQKKSRERRAAEPDAVTVDEAVKRGPAGKGKLYQEIAAGRLIARKIGRRTVILRTDYERGLNSLPLLPGAVTARRADDLKPPSGRPPRRRGRPRKTAQQFAMPSSSTS